MVRGSREAARRGPRALVRATSVLAGCLLAAMLAASGGAATAAGQVGPGEWAERALAFQYELSSDLGYRDAPWVGTHNSFNSRAEVGSTLSAGDSNQAIRIVEQLELGIRSIELDLHWFTRPGSGGKAVVVCHGRGDSEGHAGCTNEPTLDVILDPIVAWLDANPDQVLNVHLQDELENAEGYDAAAAILAQKLGARLHRPQPPAAGGCAPLPLELSRDDVRAAGAQVVLVSDCGPGSGWPGLIFDWREPHVEGRPLGYREYPDCDAELPRSTYEEKLVRYYEDSTRLTEQASEAGAIEKRDRITPATAAQMARCGVDLIDLDQLVPGDPRLAALVWSWAEGQPKRGGCAIQRLSKRLPFGGWRSKRCRGERPAACRRPGGSWRLIAERLAFEEAAEACEQRGARLAAPRTGYEVQLLRERMERKGVKGAWLGLEKGGGEWSPLDRRD